MKQKPEYWLKTEDFKGYTILDPDGWDRGNYEESWSKPITKTEMWDRLHKSTVIRPISKKKCTSCYGYGLWAMGDPSPMGPMDSSDGMPTIECPECKANANPC